MATRTIKDGLNEANPNKLPTFQQLVGAGDVADLVAKFFKGTAAANTLVLPNSAKCGTLLDCFVTAGTVKGQFNPQIAGFVPATTKDAAPTAGGDIAFLSADAVTGVEVTYLTPDGVLVESQTVVVPASGIAVLPGTNRARMLIAATQVGGTTPGVKTVKKRGTAAATGEAEVANDGTITLFTTDIGAAGATAVLTYIATPDVGAIRASVATKLRTAAQD